MIKKEGKMFGSYIGVGIFTTFLTYILISIFNNILIEIKPTDTRLSVSYFAGAFIMIGVSLYLNRKITFKLSKRRHENKINTIINYYLLYIFTAFIISNELYLIQKNFLVTNGEILKLIGLGSNAVLNYLGQRFWIFIEVRT